MTVSVYDYMFTPHASRVSIATSVALPLSLDGRILLMSQIRYLVSDVRNTGVSAGAPHGYTGIKTIGDTDKWHIQKNKVH